MNLFQLEYQKGGQPTADPRTAIVMENFTKYTLTLVEKERLSTAYNGFMFNIGGKQLSAMEDVHIRGQLAYTIGNYQSVELNSGIVFQSPPTTFDKPRRFLGDSYHLANDIELIDNEKVDSDISTLPELRKPHYRYMGCKIVRSNNGFSSSEANYLSVLLMTSGFDYTSGVQMNEISSSLMLRSQGYTDSAEYCFGGIEARSLHTLLGGNAIGLNLYTSNNRRAQVFNRKSQQLAVTNQVALAILDGVANRFEGEGKKPLALPISSSNPFDLIGDNEWLKRFRRVTEELYEQ